MIDCGLWYLAEYENGQFKLNKNPSEFSSIEDYLLAQGRFKHLAATDIETLAAQRDAKWAAIRKNWNTTEEEL